MEDLGVIDYGHFARRFDEEWVEYLERVETGMVEGLKGILDLENAERTNLQILTVVLAKQLVTSPMGDNEALEAVLDAYATANPNNKIVVTIENSDDENQWQIEGKDLSKGVE